VAGPEVSELPEVIGPVVGVAKPDGKSVSGSSTDSSCVPVSWPDAAGRGVIEALGIVPGVPVAAPEAAGAAAAADGVAAAAVDGAAADDELLPADEQAAIVTSSPAAAAAARAGRTPRTITDDAVLPIDTALPTPDLVLDT
jgi:hypothetical protein